MAVVAVASDQLAGTARALGRITPVAGQLRFLADLGVERLITAVAADGDHERTASWLRGTTPDVATAERLRAAFAAAWLLAHHLPDASVVQWFRSRDAVLGASPILTLRRGRAGDVLPAAAAAVDGRVPSLQPPYVGCGLH